MLIYSLFVLPNSRDFLISPTGTVRLSSTLDREENQNVTFKVIASDGGDPLQVSTATVSILVLDANDNKPIFESHETNFQVSEGAREGYQVVQFSATDKDIGDYGTVFYTLTGPDSSDGSFVIDQNSVSILVFWGFSF